MGSPERGSNRGAITGGQPQRSVRHQLGEALSILAALRRPDDYNRV